MFSLVVSSGLGGIKVWETFFRDRARFAATAWFISLDDEPDVITIVNLSPVPAMVSHFQLEWRSPLPWPFSRSEPPLDETPDEGHTNFRIDGLGKFDLHFSEGEKLHWGKSAGSRALYLTLHLHGRVRPIRVMAHEGCRPRWQAWLLRLPSR
ncbi:hypothetical protein GCM10010994_31690 [Chelatococcus reniformis]|uniref:Uncharacterized protein n=2 Tax=Chelatococcus reniformis TaxID=1494448 RepID=A0A916UFX0_9HYPH|nr:hypothetical protein GCM10010994_31690 [Chelatococcus reniformis]